MRDWIQAELRHARLPSGRILIRLSAIDEYLERFSGSENKADRIVDEIFRGIGK